MLGMSKPNRVDAQAFLEDFSVALPSQERINAYGPLWPRQILPTEKCFIFYDANTWEAMAWSMIRPDETEPWFHRLIGVWPEYQKQGHLQDIATQTMAAGFHLWPDREGSMTMILGSNTRYLDFKLRLTKTDKTKEEFAGMLSVPRPGRWFFYTRKEDVPETLSPEQWDRLLGGCR